MLSRLAKGVARNSTIIADRASGVWVYDTHGKSYLDMTSGIGALSTGHTHPEVVSRVREQVGKIVHAQQNCVASHLPQQDLFKKMAPIVPDHLDTYFFTNSGSDAVENAIKLARKATGRPNIITCLGGFHGRTLGCMSLSTSRTSCRKGYQPLMSGVFHVDFPYEVGDLRQPDWPQRLDSLLERATAPEETAAILVEPILGEGGVHRADTDSMHYLREVCDKYGMLWISDEVQTGVGRTGNWWGYEHFGVEPDVIAFGKGIASGFPLAGIISEKRHFETIHTNGLGGTWNGNVLATEAANATLDILNESRLVDQCQTKGQLIVDALMNRDNLRIRTIRQYGLMIAIELDMDMDTFCTFMQEAPNVGLLLLSTGIGPTIRLLPPLTITPHEIEEFSERFHRLFSRVYGATAKGTAFIPI